MRVMRKHPTNVRKSLPSKHPFPVRWLLCLLGVAAAAGVAFAVWSHWRPTPHPSPRESFPLPPYSASPYLNIGADAHYVGVAACVKCHTKEHESYLLTAHSRALSKVDVRTEPGDESFEHKASGRSYRVYRKKGQLHHEEVLRTADAQEIARLDLPVRYSVGSGHFSRTYLVEVDGFLHESPLTWYASTKRWNMSPGYDAPRNNSFERQINVTCLACHTGQVDAANSVNRIAIQQPAINCENCHGPGSLHVAFREAGNKAADGEDFTIVHPSYLSRPLLESLCGACHMSGPARSYLRGRHVTDFRPGRPLTDYRIDYHFDSGGEQMTVVGHMEQLRQSRCYQKSKNLTCVSCHDPHAAAKPADSIKFYRDKCLDCHTPGCRLAASERLKQEPADNCINCHMKRGSTDVAHVAFTHHRIGFHAEKAVLAKGSSVPELVPTVDVSHLPARERERNLGLAYVEAAMKSEYASYADVFAARAENLLAGVRAAGMRDGALAEALGALALKSDLARSKRYFHEALDATDTSAEVRANALYQLAICEAEEHNYTSAIERLKELVGLRRSSEDWAFLGGCYLALNQPREAMTALEQALSIRPDRAKTHAGLAEVYRQLGDGSRAKEHQEKARWLLQNHPE